MGTTPSVSFTFYAYDSTATPTEYVHSLCWDEEPCDDIPASVLKAAAEMAPLGEDVFIPWSWELDWSGMGPVSQAGFSATITTVEYSPTASSPQCVDAC